MPDPTFTVAPNLEVPVEQPVIRSGGVELEEAGIEPGMALALSGGGYRAMLFHVGALWRLKELQLLGAIKRIASVSGGSITAGMLALSWNRIDPNSSDTAGFIAHVVAPLRELASTTIDVSAVGWGVVNPFRSVSEEIAAYYRTYLYGSKTLQDLPEGDTRFIFTATSVQTGSLWRFSRPYMGDYRVGLYANPTLDIATAVAASSAFPPFLSPVTLDLTGQQFIGGTDGDLKEKPYDQVAVLTDGGVYDNLGIEPVWKRYDTILVSDGGRAMEPDPSPDADWPRHSRRLIDLLQNQISRLRRRQLIDSFTRGRDISIDGRETLRVRQARWGVYWGIQSHIDSYGAQDALPAPLRRTEEIARIETRLASLGSADQERIINWGYAVCDAALRSCRLPHALEALAPSFPYRHGIP